MLICRFDTRRCLFLMETIGLFQHQQQQLSHGNLISPVTSKCFQPVYIQHPIEDPKKEATPRTQGRDVRLQQIQSRQDLRQKEQLPHSLTDDFFLCNWAKAFTDCLVLGIQMHTPRTWAFSPFLVLVLWVLSKHALQNQTLCFSFKSFYSSPSSILAWSL